jgi:hypothetical protein
MKNRYLICLWVFTQIFFAGCRVNRDDWSDERLQQEWAKERAKDDCVPDKRFSVLKAGKRYPFKQAKSVLIGSFINEEMVRIPRTDDGLPDLDRINEQIVLSPAGTDSLLGILYQTKFRDRPAGFRYAPVCYFPRNAIIFLDAEDRPFAFIELCFQCGHYASYPENRFKIHMCEDKIWELRAFLRREGILYATGDDFSTR